MADTTGVQAPGLTGFHHFSPTVSDVEASAQWYERVLGMTRVPAKFPHNGDEQGGYAVLLMEPRSGIAIGLHHHDVNPGEPFVESTTGLDHIAFDVATRAELDVWAAWLDQQQVEHSAVNDVETPMPHSTLIFRDPDNIQLELFFMAG